MARLADSSQTVVSIIFLVLNLDRLLSVSFLRFFDSLVLELELCQRVPFLLSRGTLFERYLAVS